VTARLVLFLILVSAIAGPAFAVNPDERLADPVLEARARGLASRCAAWSARTSRSTIPMPIWPMICACWCASG
jgi:cytochrome c-type biogenesis protein CcmH/NrfF